ncbi:YaaC family protein [Burkholderia sp. AU30198]|uniref:YaaC family protein n=1 Tax=Burkholderia sp. AU30198 TaxID=2879627 RepID=UPI001CF58ABC|nr:YaaC family protein [Burkholderia sp. AU30198]MCA8292464.1 YaaC family protein [Burkholderia sp. AU30198]
MQMKADWHLLQFLESSENLRKTIERHHGWRPSDTRAREIAACLRQGRLFYETGAASPIDISPLQFFYGMVAFAKALTLVCDRTKGLSALVPGHGIQDDSAANSRLEELAASIDERGTLAEFNDVVASRNRLCYFDEENHPQSVVIPCVDSTTVSGLRFTFKDTLSRIPGLETLYTATVGESANTTPINVEAPNIHRNKWSIRIDDLRRYEDRDGLRAIVGELRGRYPFLTGWRLLEAQRAWGKSIIQFVSVTPNGDDLADGVLFAAGGTFFVPPELVHEGRFDDVEHHLDPIAGGFGGTVSAIAPLHGFNLSEYTLHYAALFMLSSVVRYRPQTWMHALSRAVTQERPADDSMLALVELLLRMNQYQIPNLVAELINPA